MNSTNQTLTTTYKDLVTPWVIFKLQSVKPILVARFKNRSDAEGHLQLLRRMIPGVQLEIVFDPFTKIISR